MNAERNEPLNSRIFILYDKYQPISEIKFKEMFGNFGTVKYVHIVKDRNSGGLKGIAYIKYSKASEAFKAIEAMNGHKIDSSNRRFKVSIATRPGHVQNNSDMEYNRLFLVIPKTHTETDLENVFSQYGEISNVHIVTNKDTGEPKGFAFITYFKSLSAALAIEECGSNYKAIYAKPKQNNDLSVFPLSYPRHIDYQNPTINYALHSSPFLPLDDKPGVLTAYTSPIVTYNEIFKILNIAPELEVVKELPRQQQVYDTKVFQVVYYTTAAAEHAVDRINGFEYPPGYPIMLEFSNFSSSITSDVNPMVATKISKNIEALSSTVTKPLAEIKKANSNLTASLVLPDDNSLTLTSKRENENVSLPDNSFTLFFMCKPVNPPMSLLEDTFNMFKGLRNIHVIDGKNYGYVTYDNLGSVKSAIEHLNNHKVCNYDLQVLEAEPGNPNHNHI